MIVPPVVTEINTSTYTAITVPRVDAPPGLATPMGVITEDGAPWYYATSAAGANEALMPSDTALNSRIVPEDDGTIMYVKGTTATNLNVQLAPRG